MSGGSWNYLYLRDSASLGEMLEMAERLERESPGSRAAQATRRLSDLLNDESLREVWCAIEYQDSGDTLNEDTQAAIRKYEDRS